MTGKTKAPTVYAGCTAQEYLQRVVEGIEPPDPHRIAAARSLLRFEAPVRRVPERAPSAADLARKNGIEADKTSRSAFEARAAEIRARHQEGRK